jgi:hypothetical protein
MEDFEKLGAFYLGRVQDLSAGKRTDELVLYDSKDLTTHAVIIGMTGSGKTGLGIGIIEEAAIDRIPVIAIDPKGDLGDLLLTFPDLRPSDFEPWVSAQEAEAKGLTRQQFAEEQALSWEKGLAEWGQSGERIKRLRDAADFAIYTPGSTAGAPISVLRAFTAPPQAIRDDADLFRERLQTTASSVLALLGVEADPITSREHILLSNILQRAWIAGKDLDLPGLIGQIQNPPFEKIGVMEVDQVFPAKDRTALAMQLNNLLAAPGFEAWMSGVPLDAARLLYTESGKPRVSVLSIAHLGDAERMFFVAMLLNDLIGWMRQQPGTGSLRAILYMDEIFGYLPPVASPPTKTLFLTLLKQARAYGLGVVLATQNPVDLDYKALSNAGTWCIGRLQTERDKARVMEGLEGASAGGNFDRNAMEQLIAGLGKRVFLLHSVHETKPTIFQTRWTMSYLAGPLTREQIRRLTPASSTPPSATAPPAPVSGRAAPPATDGGASGPPSVPAGIPQFHLPADGDATWQPRLLGVADVTISSAKYGINRTDRVLHTVAFGDGPVPVDWSTADPLEADLAAIGKGAPAEGSFAAVPSAALKEKSYAAWARSYAQWLKGNAVITLYRSAALKLISQAGEPEKDFRIRLQNNSREQRDAAVDAIRQKFAAKRAALVDRLQRAEQRIQRESQEASSQKVQAAVQFGTAVLGALFSRKAVSATNVSRMGSAARGVGRVQKESGDVTRASESAESVRQALADLDQQIAGQTGAMQGGFDAQSETLEIITIKPKASDVQVYQVGLVWMA